MEARFGSEVASVVEVAIQATVSVFRAFWAKEAPNAAWEEATLGDIREIEKCLVAQIRKAFAELFEENEALRAKVEQLEDVLQRKAGQLEQELEARVGQLGREMEQLEKDVSKSFAHYLMEPIFSHSSQKSVEEAPSGRPRRTRRTTFKIDDGEMRFQTVDTIFFKKNNMIKQWTYFPASTDIAKDKPVQTGGVPGRRPNRKDSQTAKRFSCEHCDATFHWKGDLKKHTKVHKKPFPCDKCGRSFLEKKSLENHLPRHEASKAPLPFPCPQCKRSFRKEQSLQNHLKRHQRAKPPKPFASENFPFPPFLFK
uniref:C2H2-type domain-containing protein n=1 Tax=Gasterosteus aculeatus aculeatus TaxID=481459 RepID=G3PG26_GASAC